MATSHKNVTSHPVELSDGRVVASGDSIDIAKPENETAVESGHLVPQSRAERKASAKPEVTE